jgi:hypothetical protein
MLDVLFHRPVADGMIIALEPWLSTYPPLQLLLNLFAIGRRPHEKPCRQCDTQLNPGTARRSLRALNQNGAVAAAASDTSFDRDFISATAGS